MKGCLAIANWIIGILPYSLSVDLYLSLNRKHKYLPTRASPRVEVECRSLDRIWRVRLQCVHPRIEYQGFWQGRRDSTVSVNWTVNEGWWIEGEQTGRRTRPMAESSRSNAVWDADLGLPEDP